MEKKTSKRIKIMFITTLLTLNEVKMKSLTELFCSIDDFWKMYSQEWQKHLLSFNKSNRGPISKLSISEMMTIVILFHQSDYRTFKNFYQFVQTYLRKEFPNLVSYSHFVTLQKGLFVPLFAYLTMHKGHVTGISFVDSTSLAVCSVKRISRNKVFKGIAKRGKTTSGWFYGFKLHLVINERGELLAFLVTPGNVSDISQLESMSKDIFGKIFGDKGYISSAVAQTLLNHNLELITPIRSNMKNKPIPLTDKALLRKRALIETVNDQLKNISQIEHTRHRSVANFLINILAGLAAYVHQEKKPSLKFGQKDLENELALLAA